MISRRQFLGEALAGTLAFVVAGCSSSSKHAQKPRPVSPSPAPTTGTTSPPGTTTTGTATTPTTEIDGFGGHIDAGSVDALRASIDRTGAPQYVALARAYVSPFPAEDAPAARGVYPDAMLPLLEAGLVVLYQRCTHLGCRVPFCPTSQWFECPCHAARFDRAGEHRAGPAPRGLDLMPASIENGRLIIDTGRILHGVADGTNTTRQAASGPSCV